MSTYAFYLDSSACSGCKACQVACKDKNNLPEGVLWRRVYEMSGGEWTPQGGAWSNTVFAYNLSMACNHCVHPKCAGVCPTDAYSIREDGIVLLDGSKCIGCRYCAWACPYGAPQYDAGQGRMTKCDLCVNELETGNPPVCVAACPLRALELREQTELDAQPDLLRSVPPMPSWSRSEPRFYVKPHSAVEYRQAQAGLGNREEVQPHSGRKERFFEDLPLIIFTLIAQMGIGTFWWMAVDLLAGRLIPASLLWVVGLLLGISMGIAFLHLGAPGTAWRVITHLRKSWLSREILFLGIFGGLWLVIFLIAWLQGGVLAASPPVNLLVTLTALVGAVSIYNMGRIYLLRTVPGWAGWRTLTGFFLSALLLGRMLTITFLSPEPGGVSGFGVPVVSVAFLLAINLWLELPTLHPSSFALHRFRLGLISLGLAGTLGLAVELVEAGTWLVMPLFLVILAEEMLGRVLFYARRGV